MAETNPSELFSVKGIVAVITGGATGIGLMMTKALALNGAAKVYIVGRRKEKLDEAAKLSPNIVPLVGDVTSKESLCQVAERVKNDVGFVNLLCCNSGYLPKPVGAVASQISIEEFSKKALEQDFDDWSKAFATNTVSVAFTTFAFLNLLDAGNKKGNCPGGKSQVLVTTSIAGYLRIPNGLGAYGSTKAAATHLIKQLSGSLAPYAIRVNGLAPGLFPSDLAEGLINSKVLDGKNAEDDDAIANSEIPAGRIGRLSDMAGTVLYMASAAGSYLNGDIHVIDGGRLGLVPGTY